jgi:hypothetical protein
VAGGVILLAGIVAAIVLVSVGVQQFVDSASQPYEFEPVQVGEPGSPVAVEPLECVDNCFGQDVFALAVTDDVSVERLGLGQTDYRLGDYGTTDPSAENDENLGYWYADEGSPGNCFFTYFGTPVVPTSTIGSNSTDPIEHTQGSSSEDYYSTLGMAARVFSSSDAAAEHMGLLADKVNSCDHYSTNPEYEESEWEVEPASAFTVPKSVSVVGWVETSNYTRYYTYDLQHANLVVRILLITDGSTSETAIREFVSAYSRQLAGLELPE